MKDNQYINGFSKMVMLVVACLLLLPAELLPHNDPREIDISVSLSLDCPDDIVVDNDNGCCCAVVYYTPPPNAYLVSGPASGDEFDVGVTEVTYQENGSSETCSFTVTVNDTESPEFTFCPDDIIQSYDAGICQTVEYELPEAEDNCELDNIYLVSGLSSGSIFPIGETAIVYAAEDTSNNISYCSFSVTITGGHASVLASDGSNSEVMAPQGALRYQRAFYLLTPEEMESSDLMASTEINSIGFTIGVAQEDTTKGHLKVYLQNTYDTISRIDSTWSTATTGSNLYTLSGIDPGVYEWQVKSLCSSSSEYSQILSFANDDLGGCNQPFNLETENITETSVKFVWELPVSSGFDSLLIVYGITLADDPDSVYTTAMYYEATALTPDTNYQWSVRTLCNGHESPLSAATFSTESPDVCDEPSDLALGVITDTTAEVSWSAASGASYYYTAIRRLGSSNWINAYSFSDTYTFAGLVAGTTYEWKVKTICPDGSGTFVTGPDIIIPGGMVCYTPEDLKTSNISTTAATLSWLEVPGAGSYEIKYRLKESISWNNAINGMTLASDGPVTIPDTIGPYDIPFEPGSLFTYDGSGLYVAWEYSRPLGLLSTPNTSLCTKQNSSIKDTNGILVKKLIKSFVGKTDTNSTALPATLKATDLRPETRLSSPSLQDSLEVTAVYTLGYVAIPYGSPVPISAMIKNFSDNPKTITVTLSIFDGETNSLLYTIPQDLDLPASCGELISFPDWVHKETGTDSIVVSVPVQTGENVVDNNSKYYLQRLNNFVQSYDDGTPVINGAGFGTGDGLILSRFSMNGCGKINAAKVYLHWSAADNPLYAVLLDEWGTILDISSQYTADSTEVNNYHSFYFPNVDRQQNVYQ